MPYKALFLCYFFSVKREKELLLSSVEWADLVTVLERFQVGSALLICYPSLIASGPRQAFVYVYF